MEEAYKVVSGVVAVSSRCNRSQPLVLHPLTRCPCLPALSSTTAPPYPVILRRQHDCAGTLQAAPQTSHGALLGLLLPLYASALTLNLPNLGEAIGHALLHAARSSAAAFKEAVAFVGAGERQALEGAVRAAIVGRGATAAGGAGGRGGRGGGSRASGMKLDLSQYSTRG